jgi:Type II secretion system (T2SS), protein E, N-terminal domain
VKLGTLLLRNAAIGLSQLEAALRNQVLYGGRLGTNLVELGFLDLEALSSYLAELSGYPVATPTLLDDADRDLLDKLGSDDAHRLRAVPLATLDSGHVAVGMVDPTDTAAIEALAGKLGAQITPYVVPELRALYYLEKHFGTPRRARFVRTARPGTDPDAAERRRQQPAGGIAMPPTFTLEPRRRGRTASQAPSPPPIATTLGFSAACERVDSATNREAIADAFVDYGKGRCDALVIFLIRDGNALGWRASPAPAKPIEELSLPLGGTSALQAAHDAGGTFLGAPPSQTRPIETALWAALAAEPPPTEVLVVPVMVKQRVVNLVYVHALGGPPPATLVNELQDLAARAQTSYLRLIRQTRGS